MEGVARSLGSNRTDLLESAMRGGRQYSPPRKGRRPRGADGVRTRTAAGERRGWRAVLGMWVSSGLVVGASSAGLLSFDVALVSAHTPHDQVIDVAFSPEFSSSGHALAVIRARIMRSDDWGVSWHEVVLGLGGEPQRMRSLAISPADAKVAYAATTTGEMLRSTDGGWSWTDLPRTSGIDLPGLFPSPIHSDVVLVFDRASATLVRSVDGGQTWTSPTLDGQPVLATALTGLPDGRILLGGPDGEILLGDADGSNWRRHASIPARGDVRLLATSSDGVVFGSMRDGQLLRSDDGGATFLAVGADLPDEKLMDLAVSFDFASDATIWVATRHSGAFRSEDGGHTFEPVGVGLTRSAQADRIDEPHFSTIAAAPEERGLVLLGGFDGLFGLESGSDTWTSIETLADYLTGLDVSPAFADDGTVAVMSYVRGAFMSRDGGDSWAPSNDGLITDGLSEGNRLAPIRRLHNVQFSPGYAEDQTMWSATWVRLLRSVDGGRTWHQIPIGPVPEGSPLRQFVLAPSPHFVDDSTIFAGTRQGELYRSTSAGDSGSWQLVSNLGSQVRSVALSPAFTVDHTIFVGTIDGLLRSTDGGVTWTDTRISATPQDGGATTNFGTQVAISPAFSTDGVVFAATGRGLYRSSDFGVTFESVRSGPVTDDQLVEAVALSPDFVVDGLVLASIRGLGLVRSVDSGASFAVASESLNETNLLIADYANPSSAPIRFSPTFGSDGVIFAFAQQQLLRSDDRGETWNLVALPSLDEVMASVLELAVVGDQPESVTVAENDLAASDSPVAEIPNVELPSTALPPLDPARSGLVLPLALAAVLLMGLAWVQARAVS